MWGGGGGGGCCGHWEKRRGRGEEKAWKSRSGTEEERKRKGEKKSFSPPLFPVSLSLGTSFYLKERRRAGREASRVETWVEVEWGGKKTTRPTPPTW